MAGGVKLAGLHEALRPYADYALETAVYNGIPVTVSSVYRSWDQQRLLRENYEICRRRGLAGRDVRLGPGLSCAWPANEPGDSAHNYRFAWDSVVDPFYQAAWNYIRRTIGWLVPENDEIHAELPNWRNYVQRHAA
jgi:hypothetical protein